MNLLERLAELESKATKAPWRGDRYDGTVKYELRGANGETVLRCMWDEEGQYYGFQSVEIEALVVEMRNALPVLLEVIKTQREELRNIAQDCIHGREQGELCDCSTGFADAAKTIIAKVRSLLGEE